MWRSRWLLKHKKVDFKSWVTPSTRRPKVYRLTPNSGLTNDESTLQRITGACPFLTWRRSGIIVRRGLVRCAKMDFCHIPQRAWPVHFHQFSGGLFYARRNPPAQPHTELCAFALQPVDERLAGEDRRRRYRNVRF